MQLKLGYNRRRQHRILRDDHRRGAPKSRKIKVAAPDVLMITSYLPDSLLFMRAFRDQDVPLKAIVAQDAGFIDPNFVKTLGPGADNVFTREVFSLNIKNRNQSVPLINELYKQRFGGKPLDGNSAREIMGVLVLADALKPCEVDRSRCDSCGTQQDEHSR